MQYYRDVPSNDYEAVVREMKRCWQDISAFPEVSDISIAVTLRRGNGPQTVLSWQKENAEQSFKAFREFCEANSDVSQMITVEFSLSGKNRSIDLLKEIFMFIQKQIESGFSAEPVSLIKVQGSLPGKRFWANLLWPNPNKLEHSGYRPPAPNPSKGDGFRKVEGWGSSSGW
jgi:hypothetical protein